MRQRPANQAFNMAGWRRVQGCHLGCGFGHAITRTDRPTCIQRRLSQTRRQRSAARQNHPQMAWRRLPGTVLQQAREHGRHQGNMGDLIPCANPPTTAPDHTPHAVPASHRLQRIAVESSIHRHETWAGTTTKCPEALNSRRSRDARTLLRSWSPVSSTSLPSLSVPLVQTSQ